MKYYREQPKIDLIDFLIYVYMILIPVEDVLQVGGGSLLKYMAIVLIGLAVLTNPNLIGFSLMIKGMNTLYYLFLLGMVSIIWALDSNIAFEGAVKSVMLIGVTIVLVVKLDSPAKIEKFENALIIGGVVAVIYILATQDISQIMSQESISSEVYRITTSGTSDANGSAARLLLPFSISTWRFIDKSGPVRRYRILYLASSGILAVFTLLTGSRTALIALIAIMLVFIIFAYPGKRLKNFIVLLLLAAVIYLIISKYMPEKLYNRLFGIERYSMSTDTNSRTYIWNNAFTYVIPHIPFWGVGLGNAPVSMYGIAGYYVGIHNTYITMLMEFGLFGIPVFIMWLVRTLKAMIKNHLVIGIAAMVGLIIVMMFIDIYRAKFMWSSIAYFLALIHVNTRYKDKT